MPLLLSHRHLVYKRYVRSRLPPAESRGVVRVGLEDVLQRRGGPRAAPRGRGGRPPEVVVEGVAPPGKSRGPPAAVVASHLVGGGTLKYISPL